MKREKQRTMSSKNSTKWPESFCFVFHFVSISPLFIFFRWFDSSRAHQHTMQKNVLIIKLRTDFFPSCWVSLCPEAQSDDLICKIFTSPSVHRAKWNFHAFGCAVKDVNENFSSAAANFPSVHVSRSFECVRGWKGSFLRHRVEHPHFYARMLNQFIKQKAPFEESIKVTRQTVQCWFVRRRAKASIIFTLMMFPTQLTIRSDATFPSVFASLIPRACLCW